MKTYVFLSPEKLKFINDNPQVVSLLYDLGLLPEEISARVRTYVEQETSPLKVALEEIAKSVHPHSPEVRWVNGCGPCTAQATLNQKSIQSGDDPKKGGEFPEAHQEAWHSGYFYGQRSIVNTLLDDEKKRVAELSLKLEDVQSELADSRADADALEKLSRGLYERIEGKHDWVVSSATQTALNYIDLLKLKNGELLKLFAEVADIFELRTRLDIDGLLRAKIQQALKVTENRPCPAVKATSQAGGWVCDMKHGHDGLHHTVYAGSDQYWSDKT